MSYMATDPDYSPAFQDEYQRLWQEARAEVNRLARRHASQVEQAEARAAFWRARAVYLGAQEFEYRLFRELIESE